MPGPSPAVTRPKRPATACLGIGPVAGRLLSPASKMAALDEGTHGKDAGAGSRCDRKPPRHRSFRRSCAAWRQPDGPGPWSPTSRGRDRGRRRPDEVVRVTACGIAVTATDKPQPVPLSRSVPSGGDLWLERRTGAEANDAMVLERSGMPSRWSASWHSADLRCSDDRDAPRPPRDLLGEERFQLSERLGLDPSRRHRTVAASLTPDERTESGVMLSTGWGLVRGSVLADASTKPLWSPTSSGAGHVREARPRPAGLW